jgi:hypothetical protein
MIEIRFDKTKDEVALLIWFLVDHSVQETFEEKIKIARKIFGGGTGALDKTEVKKMLETRAVGRNVADLGQVLVRVFNLIIVPLIFELITIKIMNKMLLE